MPDPDGDGDGDDDVPAGPASVVGAGRASSCWRSGFPAYRERAWAGRRGLAFAAVALLVLVPLRIGESVRGPSGQSATAELILVLVGGAVLAGRGGRAVPRPHRVRPRFVGLLAFAGAGAHFVLTYAAPSTGPDVR